MADALENAREGAMRLQEEVARFCERDMPADLMDKARRHLVLGKEDYARWMRLLHRKGWAIAHWPAAHGGQDWSPLESFALEDQLARRACPWILPFGVKFVGPVIYTYGSTAQKERFLPRIASGEEFWAQGYSEPNAGSDLAALSTQAVRDGDHYRVHGQKVWTTYAQWADWMFCLVRTDLDARPQAGISFLLVDMRSRGVTIKPIATMDGYHHVNEVWLEDVRVPVDNLVGKEGEGWTYAKFLLKNERTAGAIVGFTWHALQQLRQAARECGRAVASQGAETSLRNRIGELELRFLALEQAAYCAVEAMMTGREDGGEAALIKIRGTELYQDIAEATIDTLGLAGIAYDAAALHEGRAPPFGPPDAGGIVKEHLHNRAATIFAGSSEIQRNIIAKAVFGL
jgi:alkylation response protein AidB-like acyl-CoA dehydrogenase